MFPELNKYEKEQIKNGDWTKAIFALRKRYKDFNLIFAHRIVLAYRDGLADGGFKWQTKSEVSES